jgi:hypothetical protein
MKPSLNGEPNHNPVTPKVQGERPKKKVQDFVVQIRRRLAEIMKCVTTLEQETDFAVQSAIGHVRDEYALDDLNMLGLKCSDEVRQIDETVDQLLRLVEKLAKKAAATEAAAARGELFIRKRKNEARDEEIVLDHDRGLSFGQIAKRRGMSYEAVRKAYHRHKADISSCPG